MAVTVLTQKPLAEGVIITGTDIASGNIFAQVVAGEDMTINNIHGYNQHSSAVEIYIARVPGGASAVGTPDINDIIFYRSLAAKGSFFLGPEDIRIQLNDVYDTMVAYASTASKIHIWANGYVQPDQ